MPFCSRIKDPNSILSVGLIFLAVANVSQYLLQRNKALPESIADGLSGFLFGVAIATLCVAIYLRGRAMRRGAP